MSAMLSPATQRMLQKYLEGDCTPEEFESWLVAAAEDETALAGEQAGLARLRLIMIECGEGLRTADELRREVGALFAESTSSGIALRTSTSAAASTTAFDVRPESARIMAGPPA